MSLKALFCRRIHVWRVEQRLITLVLLRAFGDGSGIRMLRGMLRGLLRGMLRGMLLRGMLRGLL